MQEKVTGFFKSMFSKEGISSKRVCGFIGWLVCCGVAIGCAINGNGCPSMMTELMSFSCLLLGLDTVTDIFKDKGKKDS